MRWWRREDEDEGFEEVVFEEGGGLDDTTGIDCCRLDLTGISWVGRRGRRTYAAVVFPVHAFWRL